MRESSADPEWQHGNRDARPIPAGETLVLAEMSGPGCITHIWFTMHPFIEFYGKKFILRMYWDDEEFPSVEAPINDFFCQGHGLDVNVHSLPFDASRDGKGRNSFFPMPFRKSARIEVTNESDEDLRALYWYIDWQKLDYLPEETPYFHAKYRQEFPCTPEVDYLILEAEGKGHYVGCNLSVRCQEPSWWGEGDDRFYIDGEEVPGIKGTGAEDYFSQAYGLREHGGLFYGCTLNERPGTFQRVTVYRFHISDPIPFTKSLKFTIEHKGIRQIPGQRGIYTERADDYSSVAYWYQTEPHKEFTTMPPLHERLYSNEIIRLQGELLAPTYEASGAIPETRQLEEASDGYYLHFAPVHDDASLSVRFNIKETGEYDTWLHLTNSWDYGIYQVILDGKIIGEPADAYTANLSRPILSIWMGILELEEGEHTLEFKCIGKNPSSRGYSFGLDFIEMKPIINNGHL